MAVVNDVPGAYEAIKARADQLAAQLGIQREVLYGFFNDHARFPASLAELEAWGNTPDRIYGVRRRQENGVWTPITPGPTPGKNPNDPGFRHVITNAEDADIQRFQDWHPEILNQAAPTTGGVQRTAQANPYAGTPYEAAWEQANPSGTPMGAGTPTATATPNASAAYPPGYDPTAALPGGAARTAIVDANAYGNTETLRANIDKALRDYMLARTQEQRNQAYLDLQRWQTELGKVETQQKAVSDMAAALLSASTTLSRQPRDYVAFNQAVSGGRDILEQISGTGGPVAAYGGPTGQILPGSVWDLLARLGMRYPATPATPAGVQPGAANPVNPDLPAVNVPGTPANPGALGEGAAGGGGSAGTGATTGLPASYEQALRELDQAAGGQWGGNRADKTAVAAAWWNASPARRGTPVPAVAWG